MTTRRAKTISASDLSAKTSEAAKRAMEKYGRSFGDAKLEQGFFPDIGVFGYFIRDYDLEQLKPIEAVSLSGAIAEAMGDHARFGKQATLLEKGGITIGYWPIEDIIHTQIGL